MRSPALNYITPDPAQSLRWQPLRNRRCLRLCKIENPLRKSLRQRTFLGLSKKRTCHETGEWRQEQAPCVEFILHQSLCNHGVGNLYETGDVCACDVIYPITFFCAELDCCVVSVCVDVYHDAVELFVNFFRRP